MNEDGLKDAEAAIREVVAGARLQSVTADVTSEEQVQAYVDRHVEAYGGIDGFFNNAGIEGKQNLTEDFTNAEFQKVLAVNLTGVFLGMEKVLKVMAEQGSGSIVNAIAPGAIMTAMVEGSLRQMGGDDWEAVGRESVKPNPMQRFGKPEEVGALVAFLLGNEAGFINGTIIPIDGGQHAKY